MKGHENILRKCWYMNLKLLSQSKGFKDLGNTFFLKKSVVKKPIEIYCSLNELQKDISSW